MLFHNWCIVTASPWPFLFSFSLLPIPILIVFLLQGYSIKIKILLILAIISFTFVWINWLIDILFEGPFNGCFNVLVQKNFVTGFFLFIFSEIMFFIAFFWGFFYSSVFPTIDIGNSWPPKNLDSKIFNPMDIPLVNTLILLASGLLITISHLFLRSGNSFFSIITLICTIFLGLYFLILQYIEYFSAYYDISDSVYGSAFFICTGFHGFHVLIGLLFLIITLIRKIQFQFSQVHHNLFLVSAWYWHFVDIVWLFLYFTVYLIGFNFNEADLFCDINSLKLEVDYWLYKTYLDDILTLLLKRDFKNDTIISDDMYISKIDGTIIYCNRFVLKANIEKDLKINSDSLNTIDYSQYNVEDIDYAEINKKSIKYYERELWELAKDYFTAYVIWGNYFNKWAKTLLLYLPYTSQAHLSDLKAAYIERENRKYIGHDPFFDKIYRIFNNMPPRPEPPRPIKYDENPDVDALIKVFKRMERERNKQK